MPDQNPQVPPVEVPRWAIQPPKPITQREKVELKRLAVLLHELSEGGYFPRVIADSSFQRSIICC